MKTNRFFLGLLVTLFSLMSWPSLAVSEEVDGLISKVRQKYQSLSGRGKFAAVCTVGFVGSRVALNTAMKCVKIGAAAFITAEALHYTGLMDDLPDLSNEQTELFSNLKTSVLRQTDKYRVQIRRSLSQESVQNFFDNEKQAALGLISGAFVATLL